VDELWDDVEWTMLEALRGLLSVWEALPAQGRPDRGEMESLVRRAEAGDDGALDEAWARMRGHAAFAWLEQQRRRALEGNAPKRETGELTLGEDAAFLPGPVSPHSRPAYVCPHEGCEFTWYRRVAALTPPPCPLHGKALVRRGPGP